MAFEHQEMLGEEGALVTWILLCPSGSCGHFYALLDTPNDVVGHSQASRWRESCLLVFDESCKHSLLM